MLTKGLIFQIYDGAEFVLIEQITSLSPGANTWSTQETTPIHSTSRARTFVATLNETGDTAFTMQYVAGDPGQAELAAANLSGESVQFKITLPNNTEGSKTFTAFVTGFKPVMEVDQVFAFDVTLKVTGVVADSAAGILSVAFTDGQAGSYVTGETIQLKATFDEFVKVTGTPRIGITLTSGTIYATYASGSGTNVLTFNHVVLLTEQANATHFTVTSPIGLNGGTLKDIVGNNATLTFSVPNTSTFTVNNI